MNARVRALLVTAATLLSTVAVAATPAVAAAAPPTLSLSALGVSVHTANGQAWRFQLAADADGKDSQSRDTYLLQEGLSRTVNATTGSTEVHTWTMPKLANSTLTFTPSTGRGALKASNVLTTVSMTFTASSHRDAQCTSGSERVYAGTLSGQAILHTGLKAGGTVGSKHLTFKAPAAHVSVDHGCISPITTPSNACVKSVFFGGASGLHSMFGLTAGSFGLIEVAHSVGVKPAGSVRSDAVAAKPSRAASYDSKSGTLKVYGSTSGVVVGAGKLAGGTTSKSSHSCKVGSVTHTQHLFNNFGSKFTNATGNPLIGKSSLAGKLTLANGAGSYYTIETWT